MKGMKKRSRTTTSSAGLDLAGSNKESFPPKCFTARDDDNRMRRGGYYQTKGVMWDGMAITFAKMGLRDFFLDAKRSVYVFLVQS
jgi:hypothetical protein